MNDLETAPIANSDGNGRRKEGPGPGEKGKDSCRLDGLVLWSGKMCT